MLQVQVCRSKRNRCRLLVVSLAWTAALSVFAVAPAKSGPLKSPQPVDSAAQAAEEALFDLCRNSARRASKLFDARVKQFRGVNKKAVDAAFKTIRKLPCVTGVGIDAVPDDWFWVKLKSEGDRPYYLRVPDGAEYVTTGTLEDKRKDEIECEKAVAYAAMTYHDYLKEHPEQRTSARMSDELLEELRKIPNIVETAIRFKGGEISIKLTCGYAATIKP